MIRTQYINNFLLILFAFTIILLVIKLETIDKNSNRFDKLEDANKKLIYSNDSLNMINDTLNLNIKDLQNNVDSINTLLNINDSIIKKIKNEKNKIIYRYSNLRADSIAIYISDYLNKR